ncbi:MAG: putative glycoside hydrolase [Bacillota bacterium]
MGAYLPRHRPTCSGKEQIFLLLRYQDYSYLYPSFIRFKFLLKKYFYSPAPSGTKDLCRILSNHKKSPPRPFSATVFGFMSFAVDDQGIGQRPERMAAFADYLSPMAYPSHYGPGNYGFDNPNAHPYEAIDDNSLRTVCRTYRLLSLYEAIVLFLGVYNPCI